MASNRRLGLDFEQRIRDSWKLSKVTGTRLKLTDLGDLRPADELFLSDITLLSELKTTTSDRFKFSKIKKHQIKSLLEHDKKFSHFVGMVLIEFNHDTGKTLCGIYVTTLLDLIKQGVSSLTVEEVSNDIGVLVPYTDGHYNMGVIHGYAVSRVIKLFDL